MPGFGLTLDSMEGPADAWVPGRAGLPAACEPGTATALRRLAGAMTAAEAGDQSASDLQLADARWLLGDSAAKTIYAMQVAGELPPSGTADWERLVLDAATGDVEIVTLVIRKHAQPAASARAAAPETREPRSLTDDLRAMGLM